MFDEAENTAKIEEPEQKVESKPEQVRNFKPINSNLQKNKSACWSCKKKVGLLGF